MFQQQLQKQMSRVSSAAESWRRNMKDQLKQRRFHIDQARLKGQLAVSRFHQQIHSLKLQFQRRCTSKYQEIQRPLKTWWYQMDSATFDARKRFSWNTQIWSAKAKLKAHDTLEEEIKPKIAHYGREIQAKKKILSAKADSWTAKFRD